MFPYYRVTKTNLRIVGNYLLRAIISLKKSTTLSRGLFE